LDSEIQKVIDENRELRGTSRVSLRRIHKDSCLVCSGATQFTFYQDCLPNYPYCSLRCFYAKPPQIVNFELKYGVDFSTFVQCSEAKLVKVVKEGINYS